jgi:Cdc6-like AAA superfamily ATPase
VSEPLHDAVLDFMLHYHEAHPQFYFWVRERNTGNRMDQGYWFQGTDYCFVGLYDRSGGSNRTRSVGLVFYEHPTKKIGGHFEIVFREESNPNILQFYQRAIALIGNFTQIDASKYQYYFTSNDVFKEASDFLDKWKQQLDSILVALGLNQLFITERKFRDKLNNVLVKRNAQDHNKKVGMKQQSLELVAKLPLNQILYGPPGTGKTFRMQNDLLPAFIDEVKSDSSNREVWLRGLVKKISWWKVIAAVLYKSKTPLAVSDIAEHELVKAKYPVNNTPVAAYIWNELLAFGDKESSGLNEKYRGKYELFKKDKESKWTLIDSGKIESLLPDVSELIKQVDSTTKVEVERKRYTFITFHQSYSYEDFIKGIKPKISDELDDSIEGDLKYVYSNGVFYNACLEALSLAGFESFEQYEATSIAERRKKFEQITGDPTKHYAVFIDEINRGNIAAIFGELITLIEDDKRLGAKNELLVQLPYSNESFGVPANLHIIGTMNTADRSVEALDSALRRRFSFEHMTPTLDRVPADVSGIKLKPIFQAINERLEYLLDADHQIGHSYYMKMTNEATLQSGFKSEIIPLLKEYFYNDYGKLRLVLGDGLVKKKKDIQTSTFFAVPDDGYITEKVIYYLVPDEELLAGVKSIIKDVS